ncbi:MAG: nicotinamide-nucleotide amidohydrolase family protein [Acidobacteriota bacterium]
MREPETPTPGSAGPRRPRVAVLAVGTELLDPARPDANGAHVLALLRAKGFAPAFLGRVADDEEAIAAALEAALRSADAVVCSGGLGPTGDDLTREGAARLLGRRVVMDPHWLQVLEGRLTQRGRALDPVNRRQALTVEGGEVLPNPRGLACGCLLREGGRFLFLLPGVPAEFREMFEGVVLPRLLEAFPARPPVRTVRAVVAGLPEAAAEKTLLPWYRREGVAVSILPHLGVLEITLTLDGGAEEELALREAEVREALAGGYGRYLVSLDGISLEEALGRALLQRGWTLAVAESLTAGTVAQKVVSVPGASRYFVGGISAYADEAKVRLLGVPPSTLERFGAVSEETARAMVRGARARFGAACAVATTGVAGPGGGSGEKPAGTFWVAAATPEGEWARRLFLPLDRASVMEFAAHTALFDLWSHVRGER